MSGKFKIGFVGLLVVGALAVAMTGTALAQETPPAPAPEALGRGGRSTGLGFDRGFGDQVGLEAMAEVLGMTAEDLSLQLWGGTSLADLAEEAGVDLQDLQDAVNDAREVAMRDNIEQAVQDENLTREHADWLLEGLDNGYLGGREFRPFGGMGGMGGMGGRGGRGGFRGFGETGTFSPFQNSTLPSDNV